MLQACLLSARENNNQEVKTYTRKTATVHEAKGSVLNGRSDRAGILGTVGRRVLRLQYTLNANVQLTQSQNSQSTSVSHSR